MLGHLELVAPLPACGLSLQLTARPGLTLGRTLHSAVFPLFSPQAASALTPSCPPALLPSAHSSQPAPIKPQVRTAPDTQIHMAKWLIGHRGDLSSGDKAKMRVRTTKKRFRRQCLEGVAFWEVIWEPLHCLHFSVLHLSALPSSISSQKCPSLAGFLILLLTYLGVCES